MGGSTPDEAEPEAEPEAVPAAEPAAEVAADPRAELVGGRTDPRDPDWTKLVKGRDVCLDLAGRVKRRQR